MWFPSLLLIFAFSSVFAQDKIDSDIEACLNQIDLEELENLESVNSKEDLKTFCPLMLNAFDCVEDTLKKETGMTFVELGELLKGTDMGNGIEVVLNVKGILVDLCTEGSPLNEAYLADADCLDSIDTHLDTCRERADEVAETVDDFAENAVEEVEGDDFQPNEDCMEAAYLTACVSALVHDTCGRRAFETYNTIVKRSGIFKNLLCSEDDVKHLKTTFVDRLDVDDERKNLLRVAFDLKKRRK
jgi:hypothetical protein